MKKIIFLGMSIFTVGSLLTMDDDVEKGFDGPYQQLTGSSRTSELAFRSEYQQKVAWYNRFSETYQKLQEPPWKERQKVIIGSCFCLVLSGIIGWTIYAVAT